MNKHHYTKTNRHNNAVANSIAPYAET